MTPEAREILRKWLDDCLPPDWRATPIDLTSGVAIQRIAVEDSHIVTKRIEPEEFYQMPDLEFDRQKTTILTALWALERAEVILRNMASENSGWPAIFRRWPISHEPLRRDALHALPEISRAIERLRGET